MIYLEIEEPYSCPFHHQQTKKRAWCTAVNYGIEAENIDCSGNIPKECPLRENQIVIQLTTE